MANLFLKTNKVICDNDSDRFVLHQHRDHISEGDMVWVVETKLCYVVIDSTKLNLTAGYALIATG
jgi:hypothetical protein